MRLGLTERGGDASVAVLGATLPPSDSGVAIRYCTNAGALARIDGSIAGAFDREHREIVAPPCDASRELTLEVERSSLPTNGLPPGPGFRWSLLLAGARQKPARAVEIEPLSNRDSPAPHPPGGVALWGHSHLDVAWLWTYADASRKAMRTFANAVALLDEDPRYVFMQSQPQLYAFVRDAGPELFARVAELARAGRFDPDPAALWVEPDCNLPSGESLLRQMLAAHAFCRDAFGCEPSIAWLPDTFGFPRTLPTLLAHAGIRRFATTKLQWNDTTRFAHAQFRWRGPDGSEIVAASIDRMEGDPTPQRERTARDRGEPLLIGYGDGGGGPTREQVRDAERVGSWERPRAFFERLEARRPSLPVHDDELYLQYHRGVYTTHHDVKAENAALERALAAAEERAAWCVALHAAPSALERMRAALRDAWEIVLRNQFHDVLPGTSIAPVYEDARAEYARARAAVAACDATSAALLPRAAGPPRARAALAPAQRGGAFEFESGLLRASVLPTGTIVELAAIGGRSALAQANALALYRDRPARWEAWNVDESYRRTRRAATPKAPRIVDGGLEIPFLLRSSPATMRIALHDGEAFLRVELAVDWRETRRLLRVENWLSIEGDAVTYGAPHGTVVRSLAADTPERRAQFEVPGQRFAAALGSDGRGVAMLALDTYGWSARKLPRGGVQLGHSLLRSTTWPDPVADRGEAALSWAFAPLPAAGVGALERLWLQYAAEPGVRLFEAEDDAVLVVACKPAQDGDGVVVRVRECDGRRRPVRLRCGGRMREVLAVDGLERPGAGEAGIEGACVTFEIGPYALRSFRVRF